jgi:hypothetical protein
MNLALAKSDREREQQDGEEKASSKCRAGRAPAAARNLKQKQIASRKRCSEKNERETVTGDALLAADEKSHAQGILNLVGKRKLLPERTASGGTGRCPRSRSNGTEARNGKRRLEKKKNPGCANRRRTKRETEILGGALER